MNEFIRAVLNFYLFFFFTKRFCTHKKHQKPQKCNQAKAQNANKRTKIKNALKKLLSGKKGLICLFAFLCLRKKKKKIEKSLQ